jgi:hypothetical protein
MAGLGEILIFGDILAGMIAYIPNLIAAVIILLIGWIVGWFFGKVTKGLLRKIKADRYFKFGKGFEISSILSLIVSWIIYLKFIEAALSQRVLGIYTLEIFVGQIFAFIPGLLGAMIVILVGYVLAKYVQGQIIATKEEYSEFIGKVIFFFTIIIAISLALPFIQIDPSLINNIILILVGSIGAGIAIALGLGLKETVEKLAKRYTKRG